MGISSTFNVEDLIPYRGTFEPPQLPAGGYHRYLVQLKNRPHVDATWISEDELQHLDPDLLECYNQDHSPKASSFQPERIDGDHVNMRALRTYSRRNSRN